jgi:hypothetical protein
MKRIGLAAFVSATTFALSAAATDSRPQREVSQADASFAAAGQRVAPTGRPRSLCQSASRRSAPRCATGGRTQRRGQDRGSVLYAKPTGTRGTLARSATADGEAVGGAEPPASDAKLPSGREGVDKSARELLRREARGKAARKTWEGVARKARERAARKARKRGEREARAEREERERAARRARDEAARDAREAAEREPKKAPEPAPGGGEEPPHGPVTTLTPAVIPRSAPEIPNTGRGLYDWQGGTSGLPAGWPMVDYYMRDEIVWSRDLEPSPGHYSFLQQPGVIDAGMAKAAAKGGRLRFRIMAWMPGSSNRMPSYIETETVGGQTFPKWNSPSWLNAWANLWKALGSKYGSNPRIGWVDVGGYGAWGEAHMDGLLAPGSHITTENFVKMVADVVAAFPKAHVLLGTSAAVKEEAPIQPQLLPAVVKAFPSVGFHFDNMGASAPADGNNLAYVKPAAAAQDIEAWERWKTAPVISEWWNLPNASVAIARATTEQMHVSGLGSGNIQSSVHAGVEPAYQELLKLAGFRDQLDQLEVSTLNAGRPAFFTSTWENVNVAPTYDPWEVRYELRSGEKVAWSAPSTFDLRALLPTGGKPVKAFDAFVLPAGLARGTYTVAVQIVDPTSTVAPMRLADAGRTADGAYPLGVVTVG